MEPSSFSTSKTDITISLVLWLVSTVAFTLLWVWLPVTDYDGRMYMELADNLPRSGYYFMGEPHDKFLPLYPALMALGDWLTGYRLGTETWGHLMSSLPGACLTPILFLLSLRLGATRKSALAVSALHLALMASVLHYQGVTVSPLFTTLIAGSFLFMTRGNWFIVGLILGLAATTRYETYPLLPLIVAAQFRHPARIGRAALGFSLTASYWLMYNFMSYGRFIHSLYFAELILAQFHLFDITRGLFLIFSPFLILTALFGIKFLDRENKVIMAGFGALFLIIHVFWWFYHNRFLLPLVPCLLPAAALGLDHIPGFRILNREFRKEKIWAALVIISALWVTMVTAHHLHRVATTPPEPYNAASASLKDIPPQAAILGTNPFILASYSGHEAYSWQGIKDGEDPHYFIYQRYRHVGVRYLVWANWRAPDLKFPFLDGRIIQQQTINTAAGKFTLTYLFVRSFTDLPSVVNIYEVRLEGPLVNSPAP